MSSAYEGEGGVGGKFRRRPFRKSAAASTPYDRPPAADRATRFNRQRDGWISRLVDPASRMIVAGASRFFPSVFTKRLPPPPAIADAAPQPPSSSAAVSPITQNGQVTDADPSNIVGVTNPIPVPRSEGVGIESTKDKADGVEISELELLMKQKIFTRVEFDRLTELLRSRTIDFPTEDEIRKSEPSTSKTETHTEKQEMDILVQETERRDSKLPAVNTNLSSVPEVENASPAELAKAYMGSRYSSLSSSISGLRYQPHRDASTLPLTGQSSNQRVAPRPIVHFSGLCDSGYKTPKPQGRSAIYKMSRSPYFKAQPVVPLQDFDPSGGSGLERKSSQQTPLTSGGKQVLKRRSSFIENESGSFGPIRRIRQKSNMVSPLNDSSFIRRSLSTPTVNGQQVSPLSASKRRLLGGPSHTTPVMEDAVDGKNKDSHENFASVSQQSSFMARKILQKLDHLVPSPKEKVPSVQKSISSDDSPSKLTFNMLNGHALNSVKDIDSSQLDNVDESQKVSSSSGFFKHSSEAPISLIQDRLECNGPLKASTSRVKIFTEAGFSDSMVTSLANTKNGIKSDNKLGDAANDLVFSSASADPKKPSFSMQVPESPWELEADNNVSGNASDVAITGKDMPDASISQTKCSVVEATMKRPPSCSENSDGENKGSDPSTVVNKDNGFKVTSDFKVKLSPYAPSSLQNSMNDKTALLKVQASSPQKTSAFSQSASGSEQISTSLSPPKERTSAPVFSFGSKSTPVITFSSMATDASDSSSLKFTGKLDSKAEVTGSPAMIMTASQTETPGSDERKEAEIVRRSSNSVGISVPSGSPAATIHSPIFSAPITSAPSDCSLKLMPSEPASITPVTSSVLAAPTVASFGTPRVSESASVPTLPPVPSHQEISGTTAISTGSATTVVKSTTNELESKSSKGSSTSSSLMNFSTPAAVPTSSSGSSLFGFSFSAPTTAGSFPGQPLSTQSSQIGSGSSIFSQNSANQLGSISSSFSLGMSSSAISSSNSAFGSSMAGVKPFSFGSVSEPGQSFTRSFSGSAAASSISSSSGAMNNASLFGSSQPSSPSIFGSGFASGSSSSGFSFGTQTLSGTSSTPFGGTSGIAFSFTSAVSNSATTPLSPPQTFGSGLVGHEQMSVEDSMTDDTVQTAMPIAPAFGQASTASTPPISFGSPAVQPGGAMGFQFGGQPSPAFPQAQSSFQPSGNLGFTPGGSFSLGSGGGDKSNRRIVKVKRTSKGRK